MKHLASIAAAAALLAPLGAAAMNIQDFDALTDTTNRLISGSLKDRVIELYTVRGTGQRLPAWVKVISQGLNKHCVKTLEARGVGDKAACDVIFGW